MKVLLTFLILLFSNFSFGIGNDYPIYKYDSTSHVMTVVFTIEQAQKIDNDYDYYEFLNSFKVDSLVNSYQIVITDMNNIIAKQNITINDLNELNNKNDLLINNLKSQIVKYIEDGVKCNLLVSNKDEQISSYKKENLKLRVKSTVGFIGLGVFGGVSLGISTYLILKTTGIIK